MKVGFIVKNGRLEGSGKSRAFQISENIQKTVTKKIPPSNTG